MKLKVAYYPGLSGWAQFNHKYSEVGKSLLYTQRRRQCEDTAERVFKCISTVFENVRNNPLTKKCKECSSRNCRRQENGFSLDLLKGLQVLLHIGFSPVKSTVDF